MEIITAKYLISSPDYKHCPVGDRPEYAFIGRSNVGKSSLINMLCNHQKLAKTSSSPGKTQMINHFEIVSSAGEKKTEQWYLVDLPGYGFAKVSQQQRKSWETFTKDYFQQRENLVNIFVLIDARHSPQTVDLNFVNKLGEWQVPFAIVFTKADKTTQTEVSKNVKAFMNALKASWEFLPQHFVSSAIKKLGRDKMLNAIQEWNEVYREEQRNQKR